jgi:hypothetical protein
MNSLKGNLVEQRKALVEAERLRLAGYSCAAQAIRDAVKLARNQERQAAFSRARRSR